MTIPLRIISGSGNDFVADVAKKKGDKGVVSLTENLYDYVTNLQALTNPTFGNNMNQDAAFGGTPEEVHDGTDNAYWTGSQISGTKVTFDSSDRANTGTMSVKVDNPALNNVWQFDKGSDLTVSNFVAITMFVNVDKDWSAGESVTIYGYDTNLGAQVGVAVAIEDYFDELDFDVWHKLSIPLSDMSLTGGTIDALRMEMETQNGGKNPKFYIDDIQIEQTGALAVFKYQPENSEVVRLTEITVSFADDVTTANAADYSAILGAGTLANGIDIKIVSNNKTVFDLSVNGLIDLLQLPKVFLQINGDGTNSWVTIALDLSNFPLTLNDNNSDGVFFTISDDLSGLLHFRTFLKVVQKIPN